MFLVVMVHSGKEGVQIFYVVPTSCNIQERTLKKETVNPSVTLVTMTKLHSFMFQNLPKPSLTGRKLLTPPPLDVILSHFHPGKFA